MARLAASFPNLRPLVIAVGALALCFCEPLYALVRFSLGSEMYSHIVLIPFISLYLVWWRRESLPPPSEPDRRIATALFVAGFLVFAVYGIAHSGGALPREDDLALSTLSFLLFFAGLLALFVGRRTFRALAFPLGFLVFTIPLPVSFTASLEGALQYGSAAVAAAFFRTVGTPVFFQDLSFQLPGIRIRVAPECSGIHSTIALLITSVLAGYFFLRTSWKRALLALAVIPLGLLRNGFRVFVIGELCVHVSPDMIDSYIHHHGGPIFFALSLVPFFFFLLWLVKSDRRRAAHS